jgi:UDP-N-acetylglucosamine--N-acetylmuramyl-(pentapeptide) pyrophosphoryl-undecaprenol N-acetylglucosamine transferase
MAAKILIATGGTGGHVYPAMGLAQQLLSEVPEVRILFVGGGLEHNRYFDSRRFACESISCGFLSGHSPWPFLRASYRITKGIWQSRRILREFMPDVVVGFGSYHAFPSVVAAKLMSIPIVLHEANMIPGKVNRFLAPWAELIGVQFPETARLLEEKTRGKVKGKAIEVGVPLREGFKYASISKAQALAYFGLDQNKVTLLVFGGSQGAAAINQIIKQALSALKRPLQVLHIAGESKCVQELSAFYEEKGIKACVKSFENRMEIAWQAADLAICRSGAGTIAEQMEFEVPAILIPFPRATENHQEHNADFMVATVGGAVKFLENEATSSRVVLCLHDLLKNEAELLRRMQMAIAQYKKHARGRDLCSLIKDFL